MFLSVINIGHSKSSKLHTEIRAIGDHFGYGNTLSLLVNVEKSELVFLLL